MSDSNALHAVIATRAYAQPLQDPKPEKKARVPRPAHGPPPYEGSLSANSGGAPAGAVPPLDGLICLWDTETSTELPKRLLYGHYVLYRGGVLVDEGYFYAHDLDPQEIDTVRDFVRRFNRKLERVPRHPGVSVMSATQFFWNILGPIRKNGGIDGGFNLAFDYSMLLSHIGEWRKATRRKKNGRFAGGFEFHVPYLHACKKATGALRDDGLLEGSRPADPSRTDPRRLQKQYRIPKALARRAKELELDPSGVRALAQENPRELWCNRCRKSEGEPVDIGPSVWIKRRDSHKAIYHFSGRGGARGLDVRTLYWALTNDSGSLGSVAKNSVRRNVRRNSTRTDAST